MEIRVDRPERCKIARLRVAMAGVTTRVGRGTAESNRQVVRRRYQALCIRRQIAAVVTAGALGRRGGRRIVDGQRNMVDRAAGKSRGLGGGQGRYGGLMTDLAVLLLPVDGDADMSRHQTAGRNVGRGRRRRTVAAVAAVAVLNHGGVIVSPRRETDKRSMAVVAGVDARQATGVVGGRAAGQGIVVGQEGFADDLPVEMYPVVMATHAIRIRRGVGLVDQARMPDVPHGRVGETRKVLVTGAARQFVQIVLIQGNVRGRGRPCAEGDGQRSGGRGVIGTHVTRAAIGRGGRTAGRHPQRGVATRLARLVGIAHVAAGEVVEVPVDRGLVALLAAPVRPALVDGHMLERAVRSREVGDARRLAVMAAGIAATAGDGIAAGVFVRE